MHGRALVEDWTFCVDIIIALPVGIAVGVVLGMLGAGGSLLTVPALIFVLGLSAGQATGTSLLAVAAMGVGGLIMHARAGRCRCRHGMMFAASGMVTAAVAGRLATGLSDIVLTVSFAVLLLATSAWLVTRRDPDEVEAAEEGDLVTVGAEVQGRQQRFAADHGGGGASLGQDGSADEPDEHASDARHPHGEVNTWKVVASGAGVGVLTGFLGVGGGFMIVPALIATLAMPMPMAVGTSQLVVLTNSLAGLAGRASGGTIAWGIGIMFGIGGLMGGMLGSKITDRVSSDMLRKAFAVIGVVVAGALLAKAFL